MNQKIKNRGDWFMVGMVVRYECPNQKREWRPKDGTTWVNHILIHAVSPALAYDKAVALGKKDAQSTNSSHLWCGKWTFLGLAEVIPIDGDIADGTEMLWSDLGRTNLSRSTSLVHPKAELIRQMHEQPDSNNTSDRIAHPRRVRKRSR
jgi:hypothetical protein